MGAGHNRLLLYVHDDQAWVRAAGTWDPMAWHVDKAYAVAGRDAQHAFWGQVVSGDASPERVERLSMLHQLALADRLNRDRARRRDRQRAERARRRHRPRPGRAGGDRARSRRRAGRGGAHRGTDPARVPPRHVLLRVSGDRRLPGVLPHATGSLRPGVGAPGGVLGAATPRRPRARPLPGPGPDRRRAQRRSAGRRGRVAGVRRATTGRVRRGPGDDAVGVPAADRAREAAARAPARPGWRSSWRCCRAQQSGLVGGCSRTPTRAPGCTGPPDTGTCRQPGRLGDRGRLPEPAGARGRLAEPARRRAGA